MMGVRTRGLARFRLWMYGIGRGFSLVEVLVVLAILSLLLGLLLPVLGGARDRARQAVCAAQLSSVGQARLMYAQDHRFRMISIRQMAIRPFPPVTRGFEPLSSDQMATLVDPRGQEVWHAYLPSNEGLLLDGGYLAAAEGLFCTSPGRADDPAIGRSVGAGDAEFGVASWRVAGRRMGWGTYHGRVELLRSADLSEWSRLAGPGREIHLASDLWQENGSRSLGTCPFYAGEGGGPHQGLGLASLRGDGGVEIVAAYPDDPRPFRRHSSRWWSWIDSGGQTLERYGGQ